jgi:hypothetical protein
MHFQLRGDNRTSFDFNLIGSATPERRPVEFHVPYEGRDVPVFDWPGELTVQLAQAGNYGLRPVRVELPGAEG